MRTQPYLIFLRFSDSRRMNRLRISLGIFWLDSQDAKLALSRMLLRKLLATNFAEVSTAHLLPRTA